MRKVLTVIVCVAAVELAGLAVGMLTRAGTELYAQTIVKPPLSPPGVVFPVAWTILYALMGIGLALVILTPSETRGTAIALFAIQLVLNLAWSFIFFSAGNYAVALVELVAMLAVVVFMVIAFHRVEPLAAWLQVPYLAWLCFATYLNAGVLALN